MEEKNDPRFFCEKCDYKTNKKSSWNKHLLTPKHNRTHIKIPETKIIECEICHKEFKSRSGLWRHKKKCSFENESKEEEVNVEEDVDHQNPMTEINILNNKVCTLTEEIKSLKELILDIRHKILLDTN